MSTPIDLLIELDTAAQGKARGGAKGTGGRNGPVDEVGLMAEIRSGTSYHPAALTLAGWWAHQGVSFKTASRRLQKLFDETPAAARDARWQARREELFRLLAWIYGQEMEKLRPEPDGAEAAGGGTAGASETPGAGASDWMRQLRKRGKVFLGNELNICIALEQAPEFAGALALNVRT
jgi:hypothetical protein